MREQTGINCHRAALINVDFAAIKVQVISNNDSYRKVRENIP
jgi:hypothetical protein